MKKLYVYFVRYREIILYTVVGFLTTIVNYVTYMACMAMLHNAYENTISVAISWVLSVLFAYFTNRKWVFGSTAQNRQTTLKECAAFFSARAFSGFLDLAIMYMAVDVLGFNAYIIKILSNVFVMILNYLLSKFIVFKKNKKHC